MLRLLPSWSVFQELTTRMDLSGQDGMVASLVAVLLCAVIGYLLGSLNSAIIISKLFFRRDIRTQGSGNAGTTNMLRTYGTKYAVMTLVFDMLKGAVATLVGWLLYSMIGAPIAGFFCAFGHMFPMFYHFRGGKGVATTAMVALMLDPWTFLLMFVCFFAIVAMTKYVSLASIMCAFLYPIFLHAFVPTMGTAQLMGILTTVFVVFMHRENIKRLYEGKESKISFSRKPKEQKENGEGKV